jgi:hypothetical protein
MSLVAAHLTKVTVEHTTHSAVAAHVSKEAVRQATRRSRRELLKQRKTQHTQAPRSAKGFNPRAQRVSSRGASARSSGTSLAMGSAMGRGGFGGFGGFHGR